MNIKNLKIAREALLGIDPDLFDIGKYRHDDYGYAVNYKSQDDCGTFGCAIGWCPFIKGLELNEEEKRECDTSSGLAFNRYSERIFGLDCHSDTWDYMFASDWSRYDPSLEGLIQRMTDVIDGKKDLKLPWNN